MSFTKTIAQLLGSVLAVFFMISLYKQIPFYVAIILNSLAFIYFFKVKLRKENHEEKSYFHVNDILSAIKLLFHNKYTKYVLFLYLPY